MTLRNQINDSIPTGLFHGGLCMGKYIYHGEQKQTVFLDENQNYKNLPEQMNGEDLAKLNGEFSPFGRDFH